MEDKFKNFFSETDFDIQIPNQGHLERFKNKLNKKKHHKTISWKWMSVAASIILCLGFWLGTNHQKKQYDLADVSPKMKEVQTYFVSTIHQELKKVEATRSLKTEFIIEKALNELENLEDTYQVFSKELSKKGNQQTIIANMISNYQQRLEVLENLMLQIQLIKNKQILKDENFL